MQNVIAFANNDVITVAWSFGQKLEGCMGFAVYRIDANGKETALPAVAVFPGFKRVATDTCEKFPIQKFYWKDVYARLIAPIGPDDVDFARRRCGDVDVVADEVGLADRGRVGHAHRCAPRLAAI